MKWLNIFKRFSFKPYEEIYTKEDIEYLKDSCLTKKYNGYLLAVGKEYRIRYKYPITNKYIYVNGILDTFKDNRGLVRFGFYVPFGLFHFLINVDNPRLGVFPYN